MPRRRVSPGPGSGRCSSRMQPSLRRLGAIGGSHSLPPLVEMPAAAVPHAPRPKRTRQPGSRPWGPPPAPPRCSWTISNVVINKQKHEGLLDSYFGCRAAAGAVQVRRGPAVAEFARVGGQLLAGAVFALPASACKGCAPASRPPARPALPRGLRPGSAPSGGWKCAGAAHRLLAQREAARRSCRTPCGSPGRRGRRAHPNTVVRHASAASMRTPTVTLSYPPHRGKQCMQPYLKSQGQQACSLLLSPPAPRSVAMQRKRPARPQGPQLHQEKELHRARPSRCVRRKPRWRHRRVPKRLREWLAA